MVCTVHVIYLYKCTCSFSNFLKLRSVTASKPLQNNKQITGSCINNHKITKSTSSTRRHCVSEKKLLTSGDVELNPRPEQNLNKLYCQFDPLCYDVKYI